MTSFGKSAVLPDMSDSPGLIYPIIRSRFALDFRNTSADSQLTIEDRDWSELLKPDIAPPEKAMPDDATQPMAQFLDSWGIYSDLITESGIFPIVDTLNPYLGSEEAGEPSALLLPSHSIVRQNSSPGLAPPSANKGSSSQGISAEPSSHSPINTGQMNTETASERSLNKKAIDPPHSIEAKSADNTELKALQPSNTHYFNPFQFPLNSQNKDLKPSDKPLQEHVISLEKNSYLNQNLSEKSDFEVQPFPLLPHSSPESSPEESSSLLSLLKGHTEHKRNALRDHSELNSEATSPIKKQHFQKLSIIKHPQERMSNLASGNEIFNRKANSVTNGEKEPLELLSPDSAKANEIGLKDQKISSNSEGIFPTALKSKRYSVSPSVKTELPASISETPILSKKASKNKDHFKSGLRSLNNQEDDKTSQNRLNFKRKKSTFLAQLQLKKSGLTQAVSTPITGNKSFSESTQANPSKGKAKSESKSIKENFQKIKPRAIKSKQFAQRLKAARFEQFQQRQIVDKKTQVPISENTEPIHPIVKNRVFSLDSPQESKNLTDNSKAVSQGQETFKQSGSQEIEHNDSFKESLIQPAQAAFSLKSIFNPQEIRPIKPQTGAENTEVLNLSRQAESPKTVFQKQEASTQSGFSSTQIQNDSPKESVLQLTQLPFSFKSLLDSQEIPQLHSQTAENTSELKSLSSLPLKAINTASSSELSLPLLSQSSLNAAIIRGHIFPRINPQTSLKEKQLIDKASKQDSNEEAVFPSNIKAAAFHLLSKQLTPTKKTLSLGIAFPLRHLSRPARKNSSVYQTILPVKKKALKLKKKNIINSSKALLPQKSGISSENFNVNSRLRTTSGALQVVSTPDAVNTINRRFYSQQSSSAASLFKRSLKSNPLTYQKMAVSKHDKQNFDNLSTLNQVSASIIQPSAAKKYRLQGWKNLQSFNSILPGQSSENSMPILPKNAVLRKQEVESATQQDQLKTQKLDGKMLASPKNSRIYPLVLAEEKLSLRRENEDSVKEQKTIEPSVENNPLKAYSQEKRERPGNPSNTILIEGSYKPLRQSEKGFRSNNVDLKANFHQNQKLSVFPLNEVEKSHFGNAFKKNSESILPIEQPLSREAKSRSEVFSVGKERDNQPTNDLKRDSGSILPIEQSRNKINVVSNKPSLTREAKSFHSFGSVSSENTKRPLIASKALVPSTIKRFQVQIPKSLKRPETKIIKASKTDSFIKPMHAVKRNDTLPQFSASSIQKVSPQRAIPVRSALSKKAISTFKGQQNFKQTTSQTQTNKLPKENWATIQPLATLEKKNWQNPEIVTPSFTSRQDRSPPNTLQNQSEKDAPSIRIHIGKVRIETRPVEIKAPKKAVRPKASLSLKTYLSQRKDGPL